MPSFPLADSGAIKGDRMRGYILHLEANDVAAS